MSNSDQGPRGDSEADETADVAELPFDLELVSSDLLIAELARRHGAFVIVMESSPLAGESDLAVRYMGSVPHIAGLLDYAQLKFRAIMQQWARQVAQQDCRDPDDD